MPGDDSSRSFHFSKAAALNKGHDAILQTLDRAVPRDDGGQFFYAAESFDPEAWNGTPVIFADDHPKPEDYDQDAAAELKRINGRVVGKVAGAKITTDGHKRLMARLDVEDPEVEEMIAEGKISLSTGFLGHAVEDEHGVRTDGPVTPHHVLLFIEDRTSLPRDLGTGILNRKKKEVTNMAEEEKIAELEAALAGKDEQIAALTAENEALRAKLAEYEQAEADNKWNELKNKFVPPGMVAEPAAEKVLRDLLARDPVAFINKVEAGRKEGSPQSGVTNRGRAPTEADRDEKIAENLRKIGVPSLEFM